MASDFYVYLLMRPCGKVPFYVGKGQGQRMHKHEALTGCNPYKDSIIRAIISSGGTLIKIKVKSDLSENQAFRLEKKMIKKYGRKDMKTGILSNMTDGGEGAAGRIATEADRQRQRKIANGLWSNPEFAERIKLAQKEAASRPDQRKRLLAQSKKMTPIKMKKLRERMIGNQILKGKPWPAKRRASYEQSKGT